MVIGPGRVNSGLGKEPAIVVGNSIGASRSVLIERLSAMSYGRGTEQRKSPLAEKSRLCRRTWFFDNRPNEAPGRNQPLILREEHFALLRMRTENQTKGNP